MAFSDDAIDGMALASLELHRTIITLMVAQKVVHRNLVIELVDQALQRIEVMQMSGKTALEGPARAARLHLTGLLLELRRLP